MPQDHDPSPPVILMVDDAPGSVRLLTLLLEARHYSVRIAMNGEEALGMVLASPPDLILLDIGLPDQDGFRVCERLKANDASRDIPVIFVSALNAIDDKLHAFAAGGVDYVTKPFDAAEVLARVEAQLRARAAQNILAEQNSELRRQASTDLLTGLSNRRGFLVELRQCVAGMKRYGFPACLMMFDVDRFKSVNDRYGHAVGDEVLQRIARRTSDCLRETDVIARWGGEEFIILSPHTELPEALHLAQRLREAISQEVMDRVGQVTASFGVVCGAGDESLEDLIERADEALYVAKQAGRNCVRCA